MLQPAAATAGVSQPGVACIFACIRLPFYLGRLLDNETPRHHKGAHAEGQMVRDCLFMHVLRCARCSETDDVWYAKCIQYPVDVRADSGIWSGPSSAMYRPNCGHSERRLGGIMCLSVTGWLFTIIFTYTGFACMIIGRVW